MELTVIIIACAVWVALDFRLVYLRAKAQQEAEYWRQLYLKAKGGK